METKLFRQKIHDMRNHQHMLEMGFDCLEELLDDQEAKEMLQSMKSSYEKLSDLISTLTPPIEGK